MIRCFLDHEKNLGKLEKLCPRDSVQAGADRAACVRVMPLQAVCFPYKAAEPLVQPREDVVKEPPELPPLHGNLNLGVMIIPLHDF